MRKATIVSVTGDRQLEIPPEVQERLTPGDEYMIWITEDAITFQKIQQPLRFDALQRKIEALGPDPDEMSLENISAVVKDVRQQLNP
ncbi:MAG TPA: hypothetical protein VLS96_10735 [Nodosilinea sp.]|nr:hypothetical protein [Nodosilinea sp.]